MTGRLELSSNLEVIINILKALVESREMGVLRKKTKENTRDTKYSNRIRGCLWLINTLHSLSKRTLHYRLWRRDIGNPEKQRGEMKEQEQTTQELWDNEDTFKYM